MKSATRLQKAENKIISLCRKMDDTEFPPKNDEEQEFWQNMLIDLNQLLCDLDEASE